MSDFTNPAKIQSCLGDFWYAIYYNADQINKYVASLCFNREQWDTQFSDVKATLSRKKLRPFESINVKPFYVTKSAFAKACEVYPQHDGKYVYDGSIYFDIPIDIQYRLPLPPDIKSVKYISPKLLYGTKYEVPAIVNNTLLLQFNPFELDEFKKEPIYDNRGNIIDYKITIWAFDVKIDKSDMYYQYGYIFNIQLPSSKNYNNLINVLYDSLINGPSESSLRLYISACTGIPVALHNNEVVTEIDCDTIITDKESYEVGKNDKIVVEVGDVLNVGDPMTTGLAFYRPKDIDDSIQALSLDKHYIGLCVKDIVFENKDITVELKTEKGYTRLDLPVKGSAPDVKLFNDTVFENGINRNTQVDDTTAEKVLRSFTA